MLTQTQYHKKTYEELMEEALRLIPLYSKEWTNFNVSDPAVTILENLTAFQALQIGKMDEISEKADRALLKMVGFRPIPSCRSTIFVTEGRDENCGKREIFEEGHRFYANDIPFEVDERTLYTHGRVTGAYSLDLDGKVREDHTNALLKYKLKSGIHPFGQTPKDGDAFYVELNAMPDAGSELVFYSCPAIEDERSEFGTVIGDIFAEICAEVLTSAGFRETQLKDGTASFLCRGYLSIKIPDGVIKTDKGYIIRFRLKRAEYDIPPRIKDFYGFLLRLDQRDTQAMVLEKGESLKGYELPYKYSVGERTIHATHRVMTHRRVGLVHGFDMERFELTPFRHIVPESLEFLVEFSDGSGPRYAFSRDMKEFKFHLEEEDSVLIVDVPGEAAGGELLIAGISLYEGRKGNIISGNNFGDGFLNPARGEGGRFEETTKELIARFAADMKENRTLVSEKDYENILKRDHRMIFEKVHACRTGDHDIFVTARPRSNEKRPVLSRLYKRMMAEIIERSRLVTTRVAIRSPKYVGIRISAILELRRFITAGESLKKDIRSKLRAVIEDENFGGLISFRRLYKVLQTFEEIELVEELDVSVDNFDLVTVNGNDFKLADDCLADIDRIEVTFKGQK